MLEAATGLGGSSRIEQAYAAIVAFHNKYPERSVEVNIVGFSRGAAQARALANEFIERGVPKWGTENKPSGDYLIPPGRAHVNKLGIFDTVASYGYALGDTHLGKNLEIGKNVDSTTHLVAMNEYRDTFRLTSALRNDDNSRIEELQFAGAHSQVGGGYRDDVLAAGPLAVMYDRLQKAGIQLGPMQLEDVQRIEQYNQMIKDPEKVQEALIDSRLKAGNEAFKKSEGGTFQVLDNSAFPLERGSLNIINRQRRPFDHYVTGRGVVFENDASLSKSSLRRSAEVVGDWFIGAAGKVKDHFSEFFGNYKVLDNKEALKKHGYDEYLKEAQGGEALSKTQELEVLANYSRPDSAYIESLKLESVPLPICAKSTDHSGPNGKLVDDSFLLMKEKALELNGLANIFAASQINKESFSGLVVAITDHHVLQRVGQTSDFVVHDRRSLDPDKLIQVGRSTVIFYDSDANSLVEGHKAHIDQNASRSKVVRH